jgi:hypothetical protein
VTGQEIPAPVPPATLATVYYAVKTANNSPATVSTNTSSPSSAPVQTGNLPLLAPIQIDSLSQGGAFTLPFFGHGLAISYMPQAEMFAPQKPAAKIMIAVQMPTPDSSTSPQLVRSGQQTASEEAELAVSPLAQVLAQIQGSYAGGHDATWEDIATLDPWEDANQEKVLVATGIAAAAGYALLNTRAGLWLLSALAARPLWKQFDPLEVLYDWDGSCGHPPEQQDEEESLASLVE